MDNPKNILGIQQHVDIFRWIHFRKIVYSQQEIAS
jgi:hypothetical protein